MLESQGRTLETSWQDAVVGYSHMEMGTDRHRFHYQTTEDSVRIGFNLGHHGSKRAHFIPIQESIYVDKLVDIYIREIVARYGVPVLVFLDFDV